MKRTAILNVVALTPALIGEHTPRLREFAARGRMSVIRPVFPALTCPAQATYLTGLPPAAHGIVGNGWYHRELAEVHFWKQSNRLVHGRKLWEVLRERAPIPDPQSQVTNHPSRAGRSFTCAKLFWWFNMYSSADWSITPRPIYPADGRKIFDIYTWPYSIRTEIQRDLGAFPFATFWGPAAGVRSPQGAPDAATRWIAEAAKWIENRFQPTLNLVYLPHPDYNLQRHGPFRAESALTPPTGGVATAASSGGDAPRRVLNPVIAPDLRAVDAIVGELLDFFRAREVQVVVLSEYGLTNVTTPIHLNRLFRERGWLALKEELDWEQLDCGASRVFAVADHQVAHVYLNDPTLEPAVRGLLEQCEGVEAVLDRAEQEALGIAHPRAGDLIAVARERAWFTYYFWLDDRRAPDYARTVDIHRKPGYDPVELFTDPTLSPLALRAKIAWRLLQKKLGFRTLMDVIPLDASLVKGSHGRRPTDARDWPVLICEGAGAPEQATLEATEVFGTLLRLVSGAE